METIDSNCLSQVIHNPELDLYEVYAFGQKIDAYADEALASEIAFHLANMYQMGRLDVARVIEHGFTTAAQILKQESGYMDEDLEEDYV